MKPGNRRETLGAKSHNAAHRRAMPRLRWQIRDLEK